MNYMGEDKRQSKGQKVNSETILPEKLSFRIEGDIEFSKQANVHPPLDQSNRRMLKEFYKLMIEKMLIRKRENISV